MQGPSSEPNPPEITDGGTGALSKRAVSLFALGLAGCGNGSGGDGLNPDRTTPLLPTPKGGPRNVAEASRFLHQATFGATAATIDGLGEQGFYGWLTQQFATPPIDSHLAYITRGGPVGCATCDSRFINAAMETFWLQAITGPDQLRQRLVFALSQIFVVSAVNSSVEIQPEAHASYLDMLGRLCFGNFRDLVQGVALHPTMGHYLSHLRNQKEDPATGRIPDENFAREVMQLFSIGLWELNDDGTRRRDGHGADIPTYGQAEIGGMAKVFTGWSWGGPDDREERWNGWSIGSENTMRWDLPMRSYARYASTSQKTLVRGVTIGAGAGPAESLRIALDTLSDHPNVGPFIGSQLIKRFVTSNPSPAYVARVAQVFANNGQGVRGDMKAVIQAVLMDIEARDETTATSPTWGKLREPMIRFANWMRAFDARAQTGKFEIWNLEDPVTSLGQNPMRAPSVFNWYRPDYSPPGAVTNAGLVAPEFQITHETTTTGYANFIVYTVERGHSYNSGNINSSYPNEAALAATPDALLNRLDLLLVAGRLSTATRSLVKGAVESIALTDERAALRRAQVAIALIMVSPDYIVQK